MTAWRETVRNAPVHANLNFVLQALKNMERPLEEDSEEELVERLTYLLEDVQMRLHSADSRLIPEVTLVALDRGSQNLRDQVDGFLNTGDTAHLHGAVEASGPLLATSRQLPPLPWNEPNEVVRHAAASFQATTAQIIKDTEEAKSKFEADLQQLREATADAAHNSQHSLDQLKEASAERSAEVDATTEARSTEFASRTEALENQIQNQTQRLDQAIATINDQFGTSEQSRAGEFTESQSRRDTEFGQQLASQEERFQALAELQAVAIRTLDTAKETAEEILGVVAASATADAYLKDAEQQRRQADLLRIAAVGALIAAVAVGLVMFFAVDLADSASVTKTLFSFVKPVGFVAAVLAVAGFLVRESSQHRGREIVNKRLANQMTTFRPFLAEIPEAERNELIKEASKRYFQGETSRDDVA